MNKRYIPEGATECHYSYANATTYTYQKRDRFITLAYSGKRSKPDFHYNFKTHEAREAYTLKWIEDLHRIKKEKEARKAERSNFKHDLKEGDILYSSWGWEQTNIDFYQVTEVVSDKTVKIREIKAKEVSQGEFMSGRKVALRGEFVGDSKEMTKRVQCSNGRPYIRLNSYSWTSPWDGSPMNYSWYA